MESGVTVLPVMRGAESLGKVMISRASRQRRFIIFSGWKRFGFRLQERVGRFTTLDHLFGCQSLKTGHGRSLIGGVEGSKTAGKLGSRESLWPGQARGLKAHGNSCPSSGASVLSCRNWSRSSARSPPAPHIAIGSRPSPRRSAPACGASV